MALTRAATIEAADAGSGFAAHARHVLRENPMTALAFALFFSMLKRSGAMATSSVTFLIPVFAILWGAAILGEKVYPQLLLGMLVTLAGTALAIGLLPRKARDPDERRITVR